MNQKGQIPLVVLILTILIAGVFILQKMHSNNQAVTKPEDTNPKYIWEWKAPSGSRNLKFYTNGGFTFFENDKKAEVYPHIKQTSPNLNVDSVKWSPDERYAVLFNTPLGGIYCADAKFCDRRPSFGAKVFEEVKDIYWINNNDAIVVYLHRPNLQISKLTFPKADSPINDISEFYPVEKRLGETPYSDRFGVIPHPVTLSPDGKYIIFESGYEFASSPKVLNTITGKLTTLSKGKNSYIISTKPNYKWSGSVLEFEGGLAVNGYVGDYMDKIKPYEIIKIDLATQGY